MTVSAGERTGGAVVSEEQPMTRRNTFKRRISDRKKKHGETFSTARMHVTNTTSSTKETRKAFRRKAEEMRAGRPKWIPGPNVDLT